MNYLFLSVTAYMILHMLSFIDALLTNEDIRRTSEVYQRMKSNQPHLSLRTLSDSEIEAVMLAAQEVQSATDAANWYEETTQCQPRPHILTETDVIDTLTEQSQRVRSISGYFTTSVSYPGSSQSTSCLLLYRCDKHAGCCSGRHQKCNAKSTEQVEVDVTIQMQNASFVQEITFTNHTECGCQQPTQTQCACPHPFEDIPTDSTDAPCECQCKPNHETRCQQIHSGSHSIEWSQAQVAAFTQQRRYQFCYEDSLTELWNQPSPFSSAIKTFCPHIACAQGLTFNPSRLKCVASPSITQPDQSNVTVEHRSSRQVDETDFNVQTTSAPSHVTPQHSSSRRAITNKKSVKREKLKKKVERKLKMIQSKGLKNRNFKSHLGSKIYKKYNHLSNNGTVELVDDIIISMNKQRTNVTCKPLPRLEYTVLPIDSHFLFCSIDVS